MLAVIQESVYELNLYLSHVKCSVLQVTGDPNVECEDTPYPTYHGSSAARVHAPSQEAVQETRHCAFKQGLF